jgi:hypothetical protein
VTHIIYTLISGLIKASICLLYLRLFPNIRAVTLGTIGFITAMSIAVILATIFQCSPVDAVYNEEQYQNYTCFASIPFWYTTAVLSLVTDIWIFALPLKTILGMWPSQGGSCFRHVSNQQQVSSLYLRNESSSSGYYLWARCKYKIL